MKPVIIIAVIVVFGFLIFVGGLGYLSNQDQISEVRSLSDEELRAMSVDWDYKDILRNPEKYKGKIIHFTAKVFKVQEKIGGNYQLEVKTDCPYPDWRCGNFVVDYTGSRILQNDIVRVYAQVDYVDNYTILGTVLPVPYVTAVRLSCVNC